MSINGGTFKKGLIPWSKGKHHTDETRKKISEKGKGHIPWNKGLTKENNDSLKRVSIKKTGKPVHSEEARRKIGEAGKGRKLSEEHKRRIIEANTGRVYSNESKHKISESHKGEKNPAWRGGLTPLVQQIRRCFKYRQWRSDVFTRDDFTCVLCGQKGSWLEADHYPQQFSSIFHKNKIKTIEEALLCEEFWNINNGRTLCKGCHNKTKKKGHSSK